MRNQKYQKQSNMSDYHSVQDQMNYEFRNVDQPFLPEGDEEIMGETMDLSHLNQYLKSDELPPGQYKMIVDDVWLDYSEQGIPLFHWKMTVTDNEEYEDLVVYRHNTLKDSLNAIQQFKNDLKTCGIKIKNMNEIQKPEFMGKLIGLKLLVQVVKKNENTVYYLQRKLN